MFTLKKKNKKGSILELTDNEEQYQVTNIEGLTPPNANINTASYANGDGSSFNSSRIPNREIVITVYINGDVQKNRLTLYKYFRNKKRKFRRRGKRIFGYKNWKVNWIF